MKYFLFLTLIISSLISSAQSSDFILLKQKSRTVATYFPGTDIKYTAVNGVYTQAIITDIKNDSLFLKEYVIRALPTQLGVYILDTSFYYKTIHYNEIKAIGKSGRRFNWSGSGFALMGGGILLTVASGVSYLVDSKKFSPELLAASAGLAGVGYLLTRVSDAGMVIGKKYSLVYVKAK